ncbi:hypothetical protein Gogos_005409, partial [Gossypium gossypioides]|nr:hypothetical protein [Gossypium gossypioides]
MFLPFVVIFAVTTIAMKIVHNMQRFPFMLVTFVTILMATLIIILHAINSLGELKMLDKMLRHSDMGIYLLKEIIIQGNELQSTTAKLQASHS